VSILTLQSPLQYFHFPASEDLKPSKKNPPETMNTEPAVTPAPAAAPAAAADDRDFVDKGLLIPLLIVIKLMCRRC